MDNAVDKSAPRCEKLPRLRRKVERDLGEARAPETRGQPLGLFLLWRHWAILKGIDDLRSWGAVLTIPWG